MEQKADNRDLLIRYLLGKLNDAEQQKERELAERFFEDDDLFDELLDVESELIERYVRDELAPDEKVAFAGYLDSLPDGRDKVAFTTAMMQVVTEKQAKAPAPVSTLQTDVESRPVSLWRSLTTFIQRPHPALQYALAASLVLMAIGISWLLIKNNQLRASSEQLRDQIVQKEAETSAQKKKAQELQQQADAQGARVLQLEGELERQQQTGNLSQFFASFVLTPQTTRDLATPDTLSLSRSTKFVSITVPVKENKKYVSYRAILQTTEGDRVWNQEVKKTQSLGLGESIVLGIDASLLSQTTYILTLVLVGKNGEEVPLDYYFQVIRP